MTTITIAFYKENGRLDEVIACDCEESANELLRSQRVGKTQVEKDGQEWKVNKPFKAYGYAKPKPKADDPSARWEELYG